GTGHHGARDAQGRAAPAREMRAAADRGQMREPRLYRPGGGRRDTARLRGARDGRNQPRGIAGEDRRTADVRTGLQGAHRTGDCGAKLDRSSAKAGTQGPKNWMPAFAGMSGDRNVMNFIEANGVSLRYAVEGAGKPVVLIHEMGGTMESWGMVAPILAARRRVVRYDTRGAGFSEKIRGPLAIDTMTDDLIALLDGLDITGKVSLAGTAVGGA